MISPMALVAFSLSLTGALPDEFRRVLEAQLPVWSAVMGRPAPSSEAPERIAVERSTTSPLNLFLIERNLKVVVMREGERQWISEVVWCAGPGGDLCADMAKRTDAQWRSDKATTNHTGYAVYRDSLRLATPVWVDAVPPLEPAKKKWDKGLCEGGLCFYVSGRDSSVVRAAPGPDGAIGWWDGGYVKGGLNPTEMLHAYGYLLEKGRVLGSGKAGAK